MCKVIHYSIKKYSVNSVSKDYELAYFAVGEKKNRSCALVYSMTSNYERLTVNIAAYKVNQLRIIAMDKYG